MKFSQIAIFATGALAAKPIYMEPTLVERQSASAVVSDVNTISASAAALDSAIKAFSGISDSAALIAASNAIVTALTKGTTDAKASPDFSDSDAEALIPPIQSLGSEVQTTVKDLIAKKSAFAALGLCSTVLSQVQSQQSAATAFQNAVIAKVPSALQSAAQSLAAPITAALSSAASAFQSCPAASSSMMESSSVATATSTATGVTPPAYTTSTPPAYTTSTSSVGSFTTCTTSTVSSIPTPPTNGTTPTISVTSTPTATIIPSNGGVQKAAGFGGLILAAVVAVAAF